MQLRYIPSPAGLIKHTSRRPHEGTEDHRFSNITAASAEGQFGDLEAEAGGCTWMLKMHLKISYELWCRSTARAAASRRTLNIPVTRLFSPCSHLPLCFLRPLHHRLYATLFASMHKGLTEIHLPSFIPPI